MLYPSACGFLSSRRTHAMLAGCVLACCMWKLRLLTHRPVCAVADSERQPWRDMWCSCWRCWKLSHWSRQVLHGCGTQKWTLWGARHGGNRCIIFSLPLTAWAWRRTQLTSLSLYNCLTWCLMMSYSSMRQWSPSVICCKRSRSCPRHISPPSTETRQTVWAGFSEHSEPLRPEEDEYDLHTAPSREEL